MVYVDSKKDDIIKNLKKRRNLNLDLLKKFKVIQLPLDYKKKKSNYIIKNKFTQKSVKTGVKEIIKKINYERNSS